ncbi:MAG: hypothetical protein VX737_03460 [Pseudomonadota bacterium]|nr:hypothetical protein [Pseudomonadota bacterium]
MTMFTDAAEYLAGLATGKKTPETIAARNKYVSHGRGTHGGHKDTLNKTQEVYSKREDNFNRSTLGSHLVDNNNKTQRANPKGADSGKGGKIHYFPSDVGSFSQGHYILFFVKKQVAADVTGRKKTGKGGASLRTKFEGGLDITDTIALYMPPEVTLSDNLRYNDVEIGAMALGAEKFIGQVTTASAMDQLLTKETGMNLLETGMDTMKDLGMRAIVGAANILSGGAAGLQIERGIVATPHLELMFEGVTRREFNYTFTMTPRNETEAFTIKEIIKIFRTAMYPDYAFGSASASAGKKSGGGGGALATRYMNFPDVFEIQYNYRGTGKNNFLPQPKICSLTKCDVTYGGGESYVSVGEDGSPQKTRIALSFSEIDIMTKSQVKAGH